MFQFPGFPQTAYWFSWVYVRITVRGFPHSEICGSRVICTLPQLIAACHVLRRLPVPRHPPYALSHLTLSESPGWVISRLLLLKNSSFMKNLLFWFFLGSNCIVTLSKLKTLFLISSGLTFDIFYLQFDFFFRIVQFSRYIAIMSMVGLGWLEQPTSRLSGVRSNLLSYRPICLSHR